MPTVQPDRWVTLQTGYMGNSVPGLFGIRAALSVK